MEQQGNDSGNKPSWRGDGGGGYQDQRPIRPGAWQSQFDDDAGGGSLRLVRWKSSMRSLGLAAAALTCAVMIVLLLQLPGCTSTELRVQTIADYDSVSISPNLYGSGDLRAFEQLGRSLNINYHPGFANVNSSPATDEAFVLFVSAQAAANEQGAFVYAAVASTADEGPFTPLDEFLWDHLKSFPPRRKKLVLLDLCQVHNDSRLGVFENFVYDDIQAAVADIENLVVFCSCSPGQHSWGSKHLGQAGQGVSVFGHFAATGLRGDADGSVDGSRDGRVSVLELFKFVHVGTREWVVQNRDAAGQHPLMIPDDEAVADQQLDFEVAAVSSGEVSAAARANADKTDADGPASVADLGKLSPRLNACWRAYDDFQNRRKFAEVAQIDPVQWRALAHRLQRAEAAIIAGNAEQAATTVGLAEQTTDRLKKSAPRDLFAELSGHRFVYENIGSRVSGRSPSKDRELPDGALKFPADNLSDQLRKLSDSAAGHQQAIDVRDLAEQAASGPLGTLAPVQSLLFDADRSRREGEDRLFAYQPKSAAEKLDEAKAQYERVDTIRQRLAAAVHLRNRLYAELPELALWSANRAVGEIRSDRQQIMARFHDARATESLPTTEELDELIEDIANSEDDLLETEIDVLVLFQLTRDLARQIDSDVQAVDDDDLQRLVDLTGRAGARLDRVHKQIRDQVKAGDPSEQTQQRYWRQVFDTLKCPSLDAGTRERLNATLDDNADSLNDNWTKNWAEVATHEGEIQSFKNARLDQSLWSGLLAIQSLSLATHQPDEVSGLWDDWHALKRDGRGKQRKRLIEFGEAVRRTWRDKRDKVASLMRGSKSETVSSLRLKLVRADRIARTLHPYDATELAAKQLNPARALHRFYMAELLLAQADRYLEDFWNGWYESASQQCLAAAGQLAVPVFNADIKKLQQKRGRLISNAKIQIPARSVFFGTELFADVVLPIKQSDLPDGLVAVWLAPTESNPFHLDGSKRKPVQTGVAAEVVSFSISKPPTFDSENATQCPESVAVRPRVFFRGHDWADNVADVDVHPCRPKGVRVTYRPSGRAGQVLVRGIDRRSIVFILDCSNSMKEQIPTGGSRFAAALRTLRAALRSLEQNANQKQPQKLGLIAYGHRVQKLSGVPRRTHPDWEQDTPAAIAANQMLDIQVLNKLQPINLPQQSRELSENLRRLDASGPWGNTPLLGALLKACRELDKTGGTIVAITDGAYQDGGTVLTDLKDKLAEMQDAGLAVDLHVVGFAVAKQAADILKTLATKDTDGKFHDAPSAGDLVDALKSAVRSRPYTVSDLGGLVQSRKPLGDPSGDLRPGRYALQFGKLTPVDFKIVGGERLVFDLRAGGLRHFTPSMLERGATTVKDVSLGCQVARHDRRTAASDSGTRSAKVNFVLSLLRETEERFVNRPQEIHFDIRCATDDKPKRRSVAWHLKPNESVPTWNVDVSNWPLGAKAMIKAYWKDSHTVSDASFEDWNNTDSAPVFQVPAMSGGMLEFKLVSAKYFESNGQDDNRKVVVKVQSIREGVVARDERFYHDLANLTFHLQDRSNGQDRSAGRLDVDYTSEFIEKDEQLVFTFFLPGRLNPAQTTLHATSWHSRMKDAETLTRRLEVTLDD